MNNKKNLCRICGLDQHENPWGEDNNSPSFSICSCCGGEFGYHDCTLEGIREHRKKWIANGAKWFDINTKPPNWSLDEQMKNIPKEYL